MLGATFVSNISNTRIRRFEFIYAGCVLPFQGILLANAVAWRIPKPTLW